MKFTYKKEERLKSRKLIQQLFTEGMSVSVYPLQLVFLKKTHNSTTNLQIGVSVSKKKVSKAVQRNRIKRVLRELFRRHKPYFTEGLSEQYVGMFLYVDKELETSADLEIKMKELAEKFIDRIKGFSV